MVPTNAHKYIKISLYTQQTPTCFNQMCGHLQGSKIQRFSKLKYKMKLEKYQNQSIDVITFIIT